MFKNSELDTGVCYEYQGDKVSSAFLVDLLANGGQNGHCPESTYPARCTFEGDNKSQVLMLYFATKPVADAKAMCSTKKGVYKDASVSIDYSVPVFTKAIFKAQLRGNTTYSNCEEFNVEKMDSALLNAYLADGYANGNCSSSPLDFGVCYTPDYPKPGISKKNYYGGSSWRVVAELNCAGVWTPIQ